MERRGRSAILTYHSLDDSESVISVRPAEFRRQMEALARSPWKVVPLAQVLDQPGSIAITFDDAFANFQDNAVPVLQSLGLPATVFVISGFCGQKNDWPTQPPDIPRFSLMSWSALRDLPPGIELGAHTTTHPYLPRLDDRTICSEIRDCREEIQERTGRPVATFAYPYGAVDERSAAVIRREFRIGCGTRLQFVDSRSDPAVLPRLDSFYLRSPFWYANLFRPPATVYLTVRKLLREARSSLRNRLS